MFKINDIDQSSNESDIEEEKEPIYNELSNHRDTLNTPWIEKYRPNKIEELVLNNDIFIRIKNIIENKTMPNIILTGIPGIGKTSTVLCIAKNILGKYFEDGVLELNASDERGVKTVHETIEYFCKKKLKFRNNEDKHKYAHHKIVVLDEADNMTKKALQSINNLMETYKDSTRFAFTCNSSSDIIEAIQSRCIIIRYERLTNEQISTRLMQICEKENVEYDRAGINSIVITSQGDLRQGINNLQLIHNGYIKVTLENVYKLCDNPPPLILKKILLACKIKNIVSALVHLNELRSKGYSSSDISLSMINLLKHMGKDEVITEKDKIKFMEEFGKTSVIISKGMDSCLQLTGAVAALCIRGH